MPDAPQSTHVATTEMLARLVAFDTTSRNSNLALIDFVRDFLDAHGVPYRVSTDATGNKANIHAIIGPQQAGGIALSGHVDTVPVDGQAWSSDPFALRRDNGRLYARGAADMKGFVAACLAAVPDLQARGLARPLHLFISYDEETGCEGAQRLIDDLDESGMKPALCVVGEPSGMKPILAHKGKLNLRVRVRGKPGHSSEPAKGVNAIYAAAEAIAYVAAEARRLAQEGPFEDGFDPPHTTIHVGTIQGGTDPQHHPRARRVRHGMAPHPGRRRHARDGTTAGPRRGDISSRRCTRSIRPPDSASRSRPSCPAWRCAPDHALTSLVKQLTGANSAGKVSYGTEGGYYQAAGIPTIICGPGHIAQAHQPDEWIAQDQLDACDAFIRRLAERLLV